MLWRLSVLRCRLYVAYRAKQHVLADVDATAVYHRDRGHPAHEHCDGGHAPYADADAVSDS